LTFLPLRTYKHQTLGVGQSAPIVLIADFGLFRAVFKGQKPAHQPTDKKTAHRFDANVVE